MKFCPSTGYCAKGQLTLEHNLGHEIQERVLKLSNLTFSSAEWK